MESVYRDVTCMLCFHRFGENSHKVMKDSLKRSNLEPDCHLGYVFVGDLCGKRPQHVGNGYACFTFGLSVNAVFNINSKVCLNLVLFSGF